MSLKVVNRSNDQAQRWPPAPDGLLFNSHYQVWLVRLTLELCFRGICVLQLGLRTNRDIENFHLTPVVL
jgi:hypothetical protein